MKISNSNPNGSAHNMPGNQEAKIEINFWQALDVIKLGITTYECEYIRRDILKTRQQTNAKLTTRQMDVISINCFLMPKIVRQKHFNPHTIITCLYIWFSTVWRSHTSAHLDADRTRKWFVYSRGIDCNENRGRQRQRQPAAARQSESEWESAPKAQTHAEVV